VKPTQLAGEETAYLCKLGFHQLYQDVDMYIPVDIHMTTLSGYKVSIHTIVPLGEAWYLEVLKPNKKQLERLNKLRVLAEMPELAL